jgi:hypothetical protein
MDRIKLTVRDLVGREGLTLIAVSGLGDALARCHALDDQGLYGARCAC